MYKHSTNEVIMIKPASFQYNAQTAVNNKYQNNDNQSLSIVQQKALKEFTHLVTMLEERGVKVHVLEDTPTPHTPDSIFPNNWFSSHEGGQMVLYPMFAGNRRLEIPKFKAPVEEIVKEKATDTEIFTIYDYSHNITKERFLEGTGSIVIDRKNKKAYCSISPRADEKLFLKYCEDLGFKPVVFSSTQDGTSIYHTNVLMGIGKENVLIALDCIDEKDRDRVKNELINDGNNIIDITPEQVKQFLGNTLELEGKDGKNFIAMSETAYQSLTEDQKEKILASTDILHADIEAIEFYGGGSVRCMIAEIFA